MAARRERGLFDPEAAAGESPFDHQIYVIASDGDLEEGVSAEASSLAGAPAARQPDADLRRQRHLDRGRHRHRLHRGRRRALRGLRLARAARRLDQRRQGYVEDVPALYDAIQTASAVTDRRRSSRSTIIAWPAPNAQGTGKAHGSALGDEEVAATKKVLGFDPDQTFEVPDEVIAHTRGATSAAAGRGRLAGAVRRLGRRPAAQGALRPDAHPHAARRVGEGAPVVRRRREGRGHPRGLRRGAERDRARRCPSCGAAPPTWPGPTTPPEGRAVFIPPERATKEFAGDWYGRVLHFGIREHGMGSIMNGIALHGGTRVYGGTFLDVLRLHARRGPARGDHAAARSPTSGRTTRSVSARTARPTSRSSTSPRCARSPAWTSYAPRTPTRRWRRGRRSWSTRPAGRPDPDPAEPPDVPARQRRLRHHRRASPAAATCCSTPRAARPTSSSIGTGSEVQLAVQAREQLAAEGHPGPRGLDAVPRVVRRAGRSPTATPCCRRSSRRGSASRPASPWAGATSSATPAGSCRLEHFGASADYQTIFREFGITAEAVASAAEGSIGRHAQS